MTVLNDKQIRSFLVDKLNRQTVRPKAIIEELRVHNGNAIADVVALYKEAHCFEIKSDLDKIERVTEQSKYYDLAFRKITLVTTRKHLKKAKVITPPYWGILLAEARDGNVVFCSIRGASTNMNFDKERALLTLWKDEMLCLVDQNIRNNKSKSREWLASLISSCQRKDEISNNISSLLLSRHEESIA